MERSDASNALKIPATVLTCASALYGAVAHTIPEPAAVPLDETDNTPPGIPAGTAIVLCMKGTSSAVFGSMLRWRAPLTNLKASRWLVSYHTYTSGPSTGLSQ